MISFLVCHGKLVPLHNVVKPEWFYVLEILRYEQSKGALTMRGLKKTAPDGTDIQTSRWTLQLYDWIGPVGPIQWKNKMINFHK